MSTQSSQVATAKLKGLSSAEVEQHRSQFGDNVLTPPARDPWWKLFLEKFDDPVIRILMIAAVIAIGVGAVHGEYLEGIGIITAVLLATSLAFINEYRANREFDILNTVNDDVPIKVVRDGRFTTVPRKDIVVGDLVLVEAGEEVPADGQLIEAVSMQVNESGLTGESKPNMKVARDNPRKDSLEATTYPPDMVLRGAMTLDGHGIFEVTAVGDSTEIGKTVRAAAETTDEATPLNKQLDKLSKVIGVVGLVVAAGTFIALVINGVVAGELALSPQQWAFALICAVGTAIALLLVWLPMIYDGMELALGLEVPSWLGQREDDTRTKVRRWIMVVGLGVTFVAAGLGSGYLFHFIPASPSDWVPEGVAQKFLTYFMIAVTIIVVAVPEGLAMSVTLSLAYSMRKMTAANTLVRRMHACETIGAATVICSDKTGTLTMNEMRVFEAKYPALKGKLEPDNDLGTLIIENICANTTAHLGRDHGSATHALGNPTEGSLLFWLEDQGVDYVTRRDAFRITYQLTFSTERKWMATFGVSSRTNKSCFHIKGAPELILERCTHVLTEKGLEPIETHREAIDTDLIGFQGRGMRTLGMAYHDDMAYEEGMDIERAAHGLTWLGFLAIADPVRPEVPPAMRACRRAGIQVKMVTGDNPDTAREIARQIGLWDEADGEEQHLSGPEFQALSDDEAEAASSRLKILSRAKPLEKVRLVRSLRSRDEVVAVTGDGINDCGALNYANVGLAMGRTGKAAAKEASDIILLDDSFRTIVDAVMWGRSLYENIQRFVLFQLTINVAALGIAFLGPFIGVELPLTVIQMLWVNLIMDTFAALALATEPPHRDVLNRPPRSPRDFIVSRTMAVNIFGVAAVFLAVMIVLLRWVQQDGIVSPYELSVFFTVFVLLQFWNLFNARCLGLAHSALKGIFENKSFLLIATAIFVGQVAIVQFGGDLFRTVPLSFWDWLVITVATSSVLWIGELVRLVRRLQGPAAASAVEKGGF